MRAFIRRGQVGLLGPVLILVLSAAVSFGQESSATQKAEGAGKEATQVAATPPGVAVTPPAEAAKSQETANPPQTLPPPAPKPAATTSQSKGKTTGTQGKNSSDPSGGGTVAYLGVSDKPYEIGPEDVLFLSVLHQMDVSGQITVRPDGYVTIRYAGDIKAAGLTTQQLTDIVTEKLTTYFNHPEVNIQVVAVRSKKYYLSGEVRKPGSYPLATPKTVLEALIEGGGPADFAKTTKIYILRGKQRIKFNYKEVSRGNHLEQNILLQNGDVVVVP